MNKITVLEKTKIEDALLEDNIPANLRGFGYLVEAIETYDVTKSVTSYLYPLIAEKFGTTPSRVERAIRHAIQCFSSYSKLKNKVTNSSYIAYMALILRRESKNEKGKSQCDNCGYLGNVCCDCSKCIHSEDFDDEVCYPCSHSGTCGFELKENNDNE